MSLVDPKLLEILACPACKEPVKETGEWLVCTHASCGLRFPVRNGIPIMLMEEAQKPTKA